MHKPAPADHPVHPLLQHRWSPRAYSATPVEPSDLDSILEAARWSPSSSNLQPWSFVVGDKHRNAGGYAKILAGLVPFNQGWAQHAPVLIVSVAHKNDPRSGKPNGHAWYDVGQAVAHLSVEATARNLYVHQMGGFDGAKLHADLGLAEGLEVVSVFTVGHVGDPNALPDGLRERELAPRARKPQGEFVSFAE